MEMETKLVMVLIDAFRSVSQYVKCYRNRWLICLPFRLNFCFFQYVTADSGDEFNLLQCVE